MVVLCTVLQRRPKKTLPKLVSCAQCCHLLARPSLALRCLDACSAEQWAALPYLLERAQLHIQTCHTQAASGVLATALGQLQQQPGFTNLHAEALVSPPCWSARPHPPLHPDLALR